MMTLQRNSIASRPPEQVTVAGTGVTYRKVGNGRPLLLIHGWGGSSRHWLSTMANLADIRTIYALDLPGFGDSQPLAGVASAECLANVVIEFADMLGVERFDLNGHSFGAGVAAYLAARWPTRVQNLMLTSFSIPRTAIERVLFAQMHQQMGLTLALWQPWLTAWQPWINVWQPWLALQWTTPPLPRLIASRFFYRTPAEDELLREGVADLVQMDWRTALESAASLGDPAIIGALSQIHAPTLIVAGRYDLIMPPSGTEIAAQITPNCRLAWIDRCGHVPMVEQPEAYHQALRDFLSQANAA
ncbi:MAG: alpha/beta hydrolase [Chloroflexales bacterium]|nr:alpha/beta hydrolase [Chloroflexales bacterium]